MTQYNSPLGLSEFQVYPLEIFTLLFLTGFSLGHLKPHVVLGLFHFTFGASPQHILLHFPIHLLHFPNKFASFPQQIASFPQQIAAFPQQNAAFPQPVSHFPIAMLCHFANNFFGLNSVSNDSAHLIPPPIVENSKKI